MSFLLLFFLGHCFDYVHPYMLGLSATPVRRDGLSKVIHWFIGPTFYEHSLAGKTEVTVEVVTFRLGRALPMNIVAATNILCNMEQRNALIISKAQQLISLGHKVMIITERRSHCEVLQNELKKVNIDGGLCYGGINNFELEKSKRKGCIARYVFVCQRKIRSAYARCHDSGHTEVRCNTSVRTRPTISKHVLSPTIIDVVDEWFIGKAQFNKRKIYYEKSGFTVNN